MSDIHPTAIVHPSAELAEGASVGPFCLVGPNCIVGEGTRLEAYVHLKEDVTLGRDNVLHSGVVLGDRPQHLAYRPHPGRVIVGDGNTLREHVTIHKPHVEEGETRLGSRGFLMAGSHLAHDCVVGDHLVMANASALGGHTVVANNVTISAFVGTHQFSRVGRLVMIGGVCRVTGDVPPFCMVVENRLVGLNAVGMKRAGIQQRARSQVKSLFKIIFTEGHAISTATEAGRALVAEWGEAASAEAAEFLAFVEDRGKRPLMRYDLGEGGADRVE